MKTFKRTHQERRAAFSQSLPTFAAYFPLGLVFGVLCMHDDYAWYMAPIMSVLIYGGSIQFVAISMLDDHAGLLAILVAASFVALRNSFYGISFVNRYARINWLLKSFLVFALVDATYAILSATPSDKYKNDIAFCSYLSLFIYLYWVVGTIIGVGLAEYIPEIHGLDFILPSFFTILVIDYYRLRKDKWALVIPVVLTGVSYYFVADNYLIFAMLGSFLFLTGQALLEGRQVKK